MTVKAKFKCVSVNDYGTLKEAAFRAVYGTSGENADFAKATPNGNLTMAIESGTPAFDAFKPGTEYYLTIEAAEAQPSTCCETTCAPNTGCQ